MARKTAHLPVEQIHLLSGFGERLRLLRMRQRLTAKQVAAAAGMSVMTLRSLERGGSGVTMGAYLAVMGVLGIERDLEALGAAAFAGVAAVEDSPHRCAEGGAVSVSAPQATPSDDDSPNAGGVCDGMVAADRAADIEAGDRGAFRLARSAGPGSAAIDALGRRGRQQDGRGAGREWRAAGPVR